MAAALGAKRYLEIGVARGNTFFAIDIANKVAVDPKFRFEWRGRVTDRIKFHETTSDQFFLAAPPGPKFDIIFLDGLHTFEQTFRDFCNALAVAHDKTVFLIDDTVPSDVYSSLPSQEDAGRFRREAGASKIGWHGDVYKVVYAIHDFFPMFDFRTIVGKGNPQTLLWREQRKDFTPVYNNLESISRMTYFDMKEQQAAMRCETETEALELAIQALTGSTEATPEAMKS